MMQDVVIIGAGIVGLATALQLIQNQSNLRITVLEKEAKVGQHQSGHNSGVIHSGVYYQPGSLRAKNCIQGYNMLLDFCAKHGIEHEITGKIIVATQDEQLETLHKIHEKGQANGLKGLELLSAEGIKEKEPYINGLQAIWVPQAGIVDYKAVLNKYAELAQEYGVQIQCNNEVKSIQQNGSNTIIETNENTFETKLLINCAGLYSDKVAFKTKAALDMQILPFRGEYYQLSKVAQHKIKGLVYPAPDPAFPWLGVHFTKTIDGRVEAGPNAVLAFKREGYQKTDFNWREFNETLRFSGFQHLAKKYWRQGLTEFHRSYSKKAFTKALQQLMPSISESDLIPGGAGVRALACKTNGELVDDYIFAPQKGVINVCNAPSPAATSSLSIGKTIAEMAINQLA